jgi:hypothetical protein
LISSQRTVTGTTERISGMRALGGGEMLPKLALAVVFIWRFALVREEEEVSVLGMEMWDLEDGGWRVYSALEICPMLKPLISSVLVAAAAVVAVSRRCGSMAKADAARARIILVTFIVVRQFVRMGK